MSDDPFRVPPPANENPRPASMHEHWCEHPGCKKWGSFGLPGRNGTIWFCGEHNPEMKPEGDG